MAFSWSTFILEIVNFLVLVWILKRFFYKPVLGVIRRRQAGVDQLLADARAAKESADQLEARYRDRLTAWEAEKTAAWKSFEAELQGERSRKLAALKASLDAESEKARVIEERGTLERRRQDQELAIAHAAGFAARLLERVASAELEQRLVGMFLEDIQALPEAQVHALRDAVAAGAVIDVASAFPLADTLRHAIRERLTGVTGEAAITFRQDTALIAGLWVSAGPWLLKANVRDELDFFSHQETP